MNMIDEVEEHEYERHSPIGWQLDEWDEVGAVPVVETLRHQNRILKWVVWAIGLVLVAVMLIAGYVGWWYLDQVQPEGATSETVAFTVDEADTLDSIASRLHDDGLIVDRSVFLWYVAQKGGLEPTPGFYELRTNDHLGNVLERLRTPPDQTYQRVTFPEGFTVAQMAARLAAENPRLTADAFLEAASKASTPSAIRPPGITSLEGLMFPDTYQISNADNEAQVIERMVGLMERVAVDQEDLIAGAERLGLTPYQVLIVASMIEKEAKLDVDRPKIARVIYNRLFIGMNLEIDATLRYQADPDTPFPVLRRRDGPYNTYLRAGLPPTPISNPGRASIRAALHPSPNPPSGDPICQALDDPTSQCFLLFYVLADVDGGHAFAATYEQHLENIRIATEAGVL